jgi:hypothetical protein
MKWLQLYYWYIILYNLDRSIKLKYGHKRNILIYYYWSREGGTYVLHFCYSGASRRTYYKLQSKNITWRSVESLSISSPNNLRYGISNSKLNSLVHYVNSNSSKMKGPIGFLKEIKLKVLKNILQITTLTQRCDASWSWPRLDVWSR